MACAVSDKRFNTTHKSTGVAGVVVIVVAINVSLN
jgi:hypothetical protein